MISELIGGVIDLYKQHLKKQQNITRREIKKEELRLEKEQKDKENEKPVKEKGLLGGKVKVDLNGVKIESKKELERRERLRNTDKKRSFIENKMEAKKCEAVRKSKGKELLLRSQIIVLTIVKYVVKIIEMFIQFLISVLGVMGFAIIIFVMVLMIVIYGLLRINDLIPTGDIFTGDEDDCIPGQYVLDNSGISSTDIGSLNGTLTVYQQNLYKTFALVEEFLKGDGTNTPLMGGLSFDAANRVFRGIPAVESSFYIFGPSDTTHDVLKDMTDSSENDAYIGPHQISSSASIDYSEYYKFWDGENFVNSWKQKYPKPDSSVKDHFWMPYSVAMSIMHTLNMGSYGRLDSTVQGYDDFETFINASMDHFGIQANREECFQYIRALMSVACYLQGQGMAFINYNTGSGGGAARINYLCAVFAASSDDDSKRSFNNYSIILNNETLYKYAEGAGSLREWLIGSQGYNSTISDIGSLEIGSGKNPRIKVENTELSVPLMRYIYEKYKDDPYMTDTWSHIKSVSGQYLSSYHYGLACLLQGNHIVAELGISAPITSGGYTDDCECVETGNSGNYVGNIDINNIQAGVPQGPWSETVKNKLLTYNDNLKKSFGAVNSITNPDTQLTNLGMTVEEWRQQTKWGIPYFKQSDSTIESGNSAMSAQNWIYSLSNSMGSYGCHLYMHSYILSCLTSSVITPTEFMCGLDALGKRYPGGLNAFSYYISAYHDLGLKSIYYSGSLAGDISDFESYFGLTSAELSSNESSTLQKVVDTVLSKNGIIGFAGGTDTFTVNTNHYVVLTEKVGDGYRVTGYNSSGTYGGQSTDIYDWDFIYKGMSYHPKDSGYNFQRVIAYNPNLKMSSSLVGNGATIQDLSNILFVGDSYTVGLNSNKKLEDNGNEVFAAVSASPSQFIGSTSQSVTIGAGDGNEKTGQIPDGNYNAVIVLLGVNNLSQTEDMKTFLEELDNKFDCPIYVQKVFPVGSGYTNGSTTATEMNENIKTYNNTIKSFCDSNNAFKFIDTTSGLVEADGFLSQTSDNLHLNGSSAFNTWYNNIKNSISVLGTGSFSGNQYDVDCIPASGGSDSSSLGSIDLGIDVIDKVDECEKSWGPNNSGKMTKVENITIHYWGNTNSSKPKNSNLIGWYSGSGAEYMAHFIVDSESIVQTAPLDTIVWHAGGDNGFGTGGEGRLSFSATNSNSIGIEVGNAYIDTNNDGSLDTFVFERSTVENVLKLTKALMDKYNISIDHVIRHYDHTMKDCPAPFIDAQYKTSYDNQQSQGWLAFKSALTTGNIDWDSFGSGVIEDMS